MDDLNAALYSLIAPMVALLGYGMLTQESDPMAAQLAQEKASWEQVLSAETAKNQALQQQLEALAQQQADLQQALQAAQQSALAHQQAADRQATLPAQLADLQAQVARLTQEKQRLEAALQAAQAVSQPDTVEPLHRQITTLTQERTTLTAAVARSETALQALTQQVAALQQEKATLTEALQLAQSAISALEEPLSTRQQDVKPRRRLVVGCDEPDEARLAVAAPDTGCEAAVGSAQAVASTALAGKTIAITGTLEQLNYDQAKALIAHAGGRLHSNPNAKTSYILVGANPGSKLQRAEKYQIPQLREAEFLAMLAADVASAGRG
jgi:NAD-dependent DNA ligase